MIIVHLSVNKKPAIIKSDIIVFAEECDGKDKDGNELHFTRIYLEKPFLSESEDRFIDVVESVDKIAKAMK